MNYICLRIIIIFTSLTGCSSLNYQSPNYVKLAHKITGNTAEKLKRNKDLYLVGTGGQMMNSVQMMAMSFDYFREIDLQSAERLIVEIIDEYLNLINNNQKIKSYLSDYPFTAKNIEIRIWIYNPDRSELPLDKIYYISCLDGIIGFYTRLNTRQAIFEETYEKAKSKINEEAK